MGCTSTATSGARPQRLKTAQHSTAQCIALQCSAVQYQHSTAQCGTAQSGAVRYPSTAAHHTQPLGNEVGLRQLLCTPVGGACPPTPVRYAVYPWIATVPHSGYRMVRTPVQGLAIVDQRVESAYLYLPVRYRLGIYMAYLTGALRIVV